MDLITDIFGELQRHPRVWDLGVWVLEQCFSVDTLDNRSHKSGHVEPISASEISG